jgi:hypothetical protein
MTKHFSNKEVAGGKGEDNSLFYFLKILAKSIASTTIINGKDNTTAVS